MPHYRIRVVGSDFEADNEEATDYPSADAAVRAAVEAAIGIAADDCARGQCGCVLEACIEKGEQLVARYAIALSVEQLPPPE